ncbi:hypothetical protein FHW69_003785 [Luteibacter sp. Sphag1AF]|uniref:hypothetical protein n=1 Tax=Luteibacter sp. Sphag1AF TaxID=2587031 RepID=UPI00161577E1|nr:hypothetical protein [Luteibacter sp. Sphag1AF]MBB3229133.1 hypothetical protein [Luteibacter sp. Sphag1AF]
MKATFVPCMASALLMVGTYAAPLTALADDSASASNKIVGTFDGSGKIHDVLA